MAEDELRTRLAEFAPPDLAKVAWSLAVLKATKTLPLVIARVAQQASLAPPVARALVRALAIAHVVAPTLVAPTVFPRLLEQCGDVGSLLPYLLAIPGIEPAVLERAKESPAPHAVVPRKQRWKLGGEVW